MKIITPSRYEETVEYSLWFGYKDAPGAAWAPSCTETGAVINPEHAARAEDIRARWDEHFQYIYEEPYVRKFEHSHRIAAVGKCECGRKVELWNAMTNTCDCGREYNGSGQELAPRHQWGEETGEHWSECC